MLNPTIDKASRHSRDKCREHKPANHDFDPWFLVTGKADGVARVVGRVMGRADVRHASEEHECSADKQANCASRHALRNAKKLGR
jgi:hypothetical protein